MESPVDFKGTGYMALNGKIIYVDMDDTLCKYIEGFDAHAKRHPDIMFPQSVPGLYIGLEPIAQAIETYKWLHAQPEFEVFILTAPSIMNSHCYSEKRDWIEKHLGIEIVERLIISGHKGLNKGDYLIDDYAEGKGQNFFEGELIQFGTLRYPDWRSIRRYFEDIKLTRQ